MNDEAEMKAQTKTKNPMGKPKGKGGRGLARDGTELGSITCDLNLGRGSPNSNFMRSRNWKSR